LDFLTANSALQLLLAQHVPADFMPTLLDTALPAPSATAMLALLFQPAINAQPDFTGILLTQAALPALLDAAFAQAPTDASSVPPVSCKPLPMELALDAFLTVPHARMP